MLKRQIFIFVLLVGCMDKPPVTSVKVTGDDEIYTADVQLDGGVKRLQVHGDTTGVTEGRDLNPDTWCEITDTGAIGDSVTMSIPDDSCSFQFVTTANEAGDPVEFAKQYTLGFNQDTNCKILYDATQVDDNSVVVIKSKIINGTGERPDTDDFTCTKTGSATVVRGFDNVKSRLKTIKCVPDRDDPRVCATNVAGNVSFEASTIGNRIVAFLEDAGSSDMTVNGSGTPVEFIYPAQVDETVFITQIRCFSGCNGMKFGQFLCQNQSLTNGLGIEVRSENVVSFPTVRTIKSTEDWKNLFSFPDPTDFRLDVQAGGDEMLAVFRPNQPFELNPVGDNAPDPDDYVKITIQNNLSSLSRLECMLAGFTR